MRYLFAPIVASLLYALPSDAQAKTSVPEVNSAQTTSSARTVVAAPHQAHVGHVKAVKANASEDKAKYAARESASPQAQQYRGGDTVVIGASAATAILAVVLLIILL